MTDPDPSSEQVGPGLSATDTDAGIHGPAESSAEPKIAPRWNSLTELERETLKFRPTWWRTNTDARTLLASGIAPGRLGLVSARSRSGIVTTTDVYGDTTSSGGYLPVRRPMHDLIVADCVPSPSDGSSAGPFGDATTRRRRPRAFFTIGAPGAGKTSILRSLVWTYRSAHPRDMPPPSIGGGLTPGNGPSATPDMSHCSIVDADRVRQMLPEYADGLGSLVVQQECFDVTYDLVLPAAIDRGEDIVYDTIGRPTSMSSAVDRLAGAGYDVHAVHATCPEHVCRARTASRALRDGRLVDSGILAEAIQDARESFEDLIRSGSLQGWLDVDTSDGTPQRVGGTPSWELAFDRWLGERTPR